MQEDGRTHGVRKARGRESRPEPEGQARLSGERLWGLQTGTEGRVMKLVLGSPPHRVHQPGSNSPDKSIQKVKDSSTADLHHQRYFLIFF